MFSCFSSCLGDFVVNNKFGFLFVLRPFQTANVVSLFEGKRTRESVHPETMEFFEDFAASG